MRGRSLGGRRGGRPFITEHFRWDEQLRAGITDREAVRELTQKIEKAMRSVTLNLARWEDEPLVRAAEEVWSAEFGSAGEEAARIARLGATTEALRALRAGSAPGWRDVAVELRAHARQLQRLGLTPSALHGVAGIG